MFTSVSRWISRTTKPGRRKSRACGLSFDTYEDRTLLSGVAIYPQPAAAVAPTADPVGDFSGNWNILSSLNGNPVNGTADIQQEGNQLEILVNLGIFSDDAHGKVKGNTATAKFKTSFNGGTIKGKITATLLNNGSDMDGTITAKVPGLGKQTLDFTGSRTV